MNNQPTTWLSPNSIRRSRQMLTIVNLSIRRYLFTRNMWVLVILGGLPLIFVALIILGKPITSLTDANRAFQMTFRIYYIHFSIFFIASIFGFSLLRKEVDDRTLHYLFMQPVNRSLIIFSKYFGYIVVTWTYLSAAFLLTYFIMFLPFGLNVMKRELFHMGRAVSLIQECFVMLLALGLYGAVSMVMGTIFKSAWYGIIFYLWEAGLPYLPSTFK
ncbi:MAG TPA: ABC transporter permease subunit, partial [Candidatus Sumerlaeia bacterium]|nr:ABC transporter permease subunit [Candidatus Sumerlaeia bacterium]